MKTPERAKLEPPEVIQVYIFKLHHVPWNISTTSRFGNYVAKCRSRSKTSLISRDSSTQMIESSEFPSSMKFGLYIPKYIY